jgi:DNA-binding transcriptional LysR family regulator
MVANMKLYEATKTPVHAMRPDGIDGMPVLEDGGRPKQRLSRVSLKQWRLFHAVVDFDGFVGAASALHISQSSISHALAKLQDQLGITLFTLKGRKAQITDAGKVLLESSRELVRHAADVEELAENLRLGWEPEVRVAVTPNFPADQLIAAFRKLSTLPKKVRLNVDELGRSDIRQRLHDDAVDLAIGPEKVFGFACEQLAEIENVAVAHVGSPLFEAGTELDEADLHKQYQVVFSGFDESFHGDSCSQAAHGPRRWKVNSLDSAIEALRHGLGYAWLPRYRVQHWLDDGSLRVLPLKSGSAYITPMYLIYGRSVAADSCSQRFADALLSLAAERRTRGHAGFMGAADRVAAGTQRC